MPSCYVDVLIDKEPNHHHMKLYRHHMNHHAIIYVRHCTPSTAAAMLFESTTGKHTSCRHRGYGATISWCRQTNLPLPNDDFGRRNKSWNADFEGSTFQGREYSIWATNRWKLNRKSAFHLLFILPNSSFGEHKILNARLVQPDGAMLTLHMRCLHSTMRVYIHTYVIIVLWQSRTFKPRSNVTRKYRQEQSITTKAMIWQRMRSLVIDFWLHCHSIALLVIDTYPRLESATFFPDTQSASISRRQLVPYFSTISILNISTKVLTTNPGWHFCRNVQNGDRRKMGD